MTSPAEKAELSGATGTSAAPGPVPMLIVHALSASKAAVMLANNLGRSERRVDEFMGEANSSNQSKAWEPASS